MTFFKKNHDSATPRVSLNWQRPGGFLPLLLQPLLQRATSNLRVILWVNGLLLLLIAYNLSRLTWLAFPPPLQEDAPPPLLQMAMMPSAPANQPNPQTTAGNTLVTPQDIANWHLLGETNESVSISAVGNAPATSLALNLRGVIASRDRKTARAIIADSSGTENFYALDAQVPGGAVLKEIHTDRVILLRGGSHETLMLPKDELGDDGGQFGAPPLPVANPDKAMLDEYRDALQNHPETLADRIQPMPVHEGGKFVGYRFLSPRDPTLLSRLGMQPGDVVTAVNGIQLDNPLKGMQALRGISAEDEIRIDTLRNGTPRSFILRMN